MVCLRSNKAHETAHRALPRALAAALAAAACAAVGAPVPPAEAPAPLRAQTPEPAVQHTVIEDDNVRIEELRVSGLTRRVLVQPKVEGAAAYEIQPAEPGRDTTPARGGSGQRVWRIFSF